MCVTYYEIGRMIVEQEQNGDTRAEYGKNLLETLSDHLTKIYGKGWSVGNLKNARQFYKTYTNRIGESVTNEFTVAELLQFSFTLSFTHDVVLMRIENIDERNIYEIEAKENNWSIRELKRQQISVYYERIALSKNREEVKHLSKEGQTFEKAKDLVKSPFVLEFLGLEEDYKYSESDLENAIITNLQSFLLELRRGFLFEARQKRFSFDDKSFYIDLVFYNRLLQCYVIIDLKVGELTHQDLGQMQMYVNYFDRHYRKDFEKPIVVVLLYRKRSDIIVELTLSEDANIYVAEYSLYLPDKSLLQKNIRMDRDL